MRSGGVRRIFDPLTLSRSMGGKSLSSSELAVLLFGTSSVELEEGSVCCLFKTNSFFKLFSIYIPSMIPRPNSKKAATTRAAQSSM